MSAMMPLRLLRRGFPMEGGATPMENLRFPTGPSPHPTGNPPPSACGWKTHAFPTVTETCIAAATSLHFFQDQKRAQRTLFAGALNYAIGPGESA